MATTTERRMRAKGLAILLAVAMSFSAAAAAATDRSAQDTEVHELLARPLSAAGAVRIAILRQPAVRAARHDVEVAEGHRIQAGLLPNPEIEFDLRQSSDTSDPMQSDVEVALDIGRLMLTPIRVGVASAGVEAEEHAVERDLALLAHRVRVAAYEVQTAERRWRSAIGMLEIAVAARDAARALHAAGNLNGLDLARYESADRDARIEADTLELALRSAREQLQRQLGLHGTELAWQVEPLAWEALSSMPEVGDVEARAIRASHELARLRSRITALARSARLARAEGWLPGLMADVHAEHDDVRWEIGAGLRVSVPLFDRRQGDRAALTAARNALESRYRAEAIRVRSHAREARDRAQSTAARAEHWRAEVVPAKRRVVAETLLQHNAMEASVFSLLEAKREELVAELGADGAWLDALTARSALDAALDGAPVDSPALGRRATMISAAALSGGH
jgi:outer membrane protein, heavy metal efflux system